MSVPRSIFNLDVSNSAHAYANRTIDVYHTGWVKVGVLCV